MTRNNRFDNTARATLDGAQPTRSASTTHNGRARTLQRKADRQRKTFAQTMGA